MPAKFEWDDEKNRTNIQKHGISFEQARTVFNGPILSQVDKRFAYNERRVVSIGMMQEALIITLVHTDRFGVTRIISARAANRKERKRFYEQIHKTLDP